MLVWSREFKPRDSRMLASTIMMRHAYAYELDHLGVARSRSVRLGLRMYDSVM